MNDTGSGVERIVPAASVGEDDTISIGLTIVDSMAGAVEGLIVSM